MDILVVYSDDSVRAETLAQLAREKGHRVHGVKPGQRLPQSEEPWLGAVFFCQRIASREVQMLMEDLRYLDADLLLVTSDSPPFQSDHLHWRTPDTPDAELLQVIAANCRAVNVAPAIRDHLVGPLITAVRQTLVEMAGVEVMVRSVYQTTAAPPLGDLSAFLDLTMATEGFLILSLSRRTAESLGRRILAEVTTDPTPELIQDCVNEVGNVVAGQAKALLAGTPYHFTFSPPGISIAENRRWLRSTAVVLAFETEIGNMTLQFCY